MGIANFFLPKDLRVTMVFSFSRWHFGRAIKLYKIFTLWIINKGYHAAAWRCEIFFLVLKTMLLTCSTIHVPGATILLVSAKNQDLWPVPTRLVLDFRTSLQIWLAENTKRVRSAYRRYSGSGQPDSWCWPKGSGPLGTRMSLRSFKKPQRFPNIVQRLSEGHTNVSDNFSNMSEDLRRFRYPH